MADIEDLQHGAPNREGEIVRWLARIAASLERAWPDPEPSSDRIEKPAAQGGADAFVWEPERVRLRPIKEVAGISIDLLVGMDPLRDRLLDNTRRFACGLPANNVLIWGARGMGKSSVVKAAYRAVRLENPDQAPGLVEIHREDIASLSELLICLRGCTRRFILFCDDLSFDAADTGYKSLKSLLEGGIEACPENVLFYATSNRRHLMAREAIENESEQALHPGETVEEKVSLSDRFGLWLGVHACDQRNYLEMVERYANAFGLSVPLEILRRRALEWSITRGARSGRVAWQFIQDLVGREDLPANEGMPANPDT